jgi:hypothetical protein
MEATSRALYAWADVAEKTKARAVDRETEKGVVNVEHGNKDG